MFFIFSVKMEVVDICCGIGGFSLGFKKAGFKVKAGIDINEKALKVFKRNFRNAKAIRADLKELDPGDIPDADVYIAGIPCQPFSTANLKASWDTRLFGKFLEIVITKKKMFVMENVLPLAYALGHGIVLDAYDFGVPQKRRRFFFANFPILPYRKIHKPLGLFFPNLRELRWEKSYESWAISRRVSGPYDPAFTICVRDIPQLIFVFNDGKIRKLNINDYKILFGFPKSFKIREGEKELIGECVYPPVAYHIAKSSAYYLPIFNKIMGKWTRLPLRFDGRLCVQLSLIP